MFGLPQRIPVVLIRHTPSLHFVACCATPPSCLWRSCSWLFFLPCDLSSALRFHHTWHQDKRCHHPEGPPSSGVQVRKSQGAILDHSPSLFTGISILRPPGPGGPGKRSHCRCCYHNVLHPFPLLRGRLTPHMFILEFSMDGRPGRRICRWCFCQPHSGVGLSSGQVSQFYCQFQ